MRAGRLRLAVRPSAAALTMIDVSGDEPGLRESVSVEVRVAQEAVGTPAS